MKAITIQQPYATLIANGEKWIENRTWPTKHRGRIAIHAGKGSRYLTPAELVAYPTGMVIAVAELVACVSLAEVSRGDASATWRLDAAGVDADKLLAHEHAEGPWCWVLADVRKLKKPVCETGKQGLWEWDGGFDGTAEEIDKAGLEPIIVDARDESN